MSNVSKSTNVVNEQHQDNDTRTDIILKMRGYKPLAVRVQAAKGHKHWQRILTSAKLYLDTTTLLRDAQNMLIRLNERSEAEDVEQMIARLEMKIQFMEKYGRGL